MGTSSLMMTVFQPEFNSIAYLNCPPVDCMLLGEVWEGRQHHHTGFLLGKTPGRRKSSLLHSDGALTEPKASVSSVIVASRQKATDSHTLSSQRETGWTSTRLRQENSSGMSVEDLL